MAKRLFVPTGTYRVQSTYQPLLAMHIENPEGIYIDAYSPLRITRKSPPAFVLKPVKISGQIK